MTQYVNQLRKAPLSMRALIVLLGALAFLPLAFMSREIVTGDFAGLNISNADVLGSGTFLIFLTMLTITPLIAITGHREIGPLRWWYGVMFFTTAFIDLILASIVTSEDFKGGFLGRVTGHTFLLVGTATVLLTLILVATANRRSQRALGKHWKQVQRITYVVWALIVIHLALLFGLTGLRFHQALYASVPLAILRIPPVRRWCEAGHHRSPLVWLFLLVLLASFAWGYFHLVGEEFNRGLNALSNHPEDT